MYRRSDGGIELWDLLYWFPVSASSVLTEAVVQQNLGSDLELQVEVDAAAKELPRARAAVCWLGQDWALQLRLEEERLSLGPKREESNSREFSGF